MLRFVALSLFIKMQEWEVDDPAEGHLVRVDQLQAFRELATQAIENVITDFGAISNKQQQIPWFTLEAAYNGLYLLGGRKLRQRRFHLTCSSNCQRHQPLCSEHTGELGEFVDFLATICTGAWYTDALHNAIRGQRLLEDTERTSRGQV